ncbi:plasmid recombination protein [Agrobacterium sp. SHOUNA12C]|nr:plasmid recombination protein [Agrobacterium sp. BETTINA12B]MCJ9759751.1 plasmid recombination protein [Agrobacterium sp. SHOUNA12C]
MGFQFVHMASFSRKADAQGRGTGFIFAEARRDPAASVHVAQPLPPTVVYGLEVAEVEALHDAAADAARTVPKAGTPRKLRQDHKTLHTVIASHPYTMDEIRDDPEKRKEAEVWEKRTIAWLRFQYGDDLKSVVRHDDESHYHIHAYIVPDADTEMRALRHHPGVTAKRAAMAEGPPAGEDSKAMSKRGDAAYKSAMRAWQDSYHAVVGIPCGLARLGPRRRNLSRGDWQRDQSQAKALQAALDRAAAVKAKIEAHIITKKAEVETLVSTAATEAAALRAEADAAMADAARRLAAAKAATEAAKAAHDAAVHEQAEARGMMSRMREEAVRVAAKAARLQHLPSVLRTVFDGFRQSRVADRIRAAVDTDMAALRERAASALKLAAAADSARKQAEARADTIASALTETTAQRDAARRDVARFRPPEPTPGPSLGPGMRPTPRRR